MNEREQGNLLYRIRHTEFYAEHNIIKIIFQ